MEDQDKDKFNAELRESEDRYRSVTETSIDAIITADSKDSILTWNKGAELTFGYGKEIIGSSVTVIIPEKYRKAHLAGVKRFLETGERHHIGKTIELEAIRKNGTIFPIELSLSTWNSLAGINFGAIIRDISERKNIERVQKNVQHIMRHDIRAPLVGITGLAKILQKNNNLTEKQQKAIILIQELGEKTLKFIDRTRDLFQMEQGVYKLEPTILNLVEVFKNIQEELAPVLSKKGIHFTLNLNGKKIQEVSEYMIQGDEDFLEMMFANLIKNAIDASPESADVSVSVDMKKRNGKSFHVIDIHNLGIVPQDIREKFFEPYRTSGKKGGTGLGTYSSFLIAKAHKGHIHFTTSDENGTNVIVELPEQIDSSNDLE